MAALCAVAIAGPNARANSITGSIGFGASGVTVDSPNLATATDFEVAHPFTSTESGTYSTVPMFTPVTFTGFQFNPPAAGVTPLWTFDVGLDVYSFDATSLQSFYNSSLEEWDIGGRGVATVTGFSATEGTWNVNLSQSGASFVFDSSAAPNSPVPDGGSTVTLLGSALMGLCAFSRKFSR
jgi:hypothetical protein